MTVPDLGRGPVPDRALIDAMAGDQGLDWSEARREQGLAQAVSMRPALLALRAKPLAYVGDVIEPAHALKWLDATGEENR
ncbi:hypothetical protein [Kineococcus sp. SYSU DK003]|uniref:hypothetical protein n=1 Tax=Kineococcus sp. SYSU DK003 TaxID=3383124 RepID=UPI003D7D51D2